MALFFTFYESFTTLCVFAVLVCMTFGVLTIILNRKAKEQARRQARARAFTQRQRTPPRELPVTPPPSQSSITDRVYAFWRSMNGCGSYRPTLQRSRSFYRGQVSIEENLEEDERIITVRIMELTIEDDPNAEGDRARNEGGSTIQEIDG